MAIPVTLLRELQGADAASAWRALFQHAWDTCSQPVSGTVKKSYLARERAMKSVDLFLATAGWDLWSSYEASVALTADRLHALWGEQQGGCAVLILDGLSLREVPWILAGLDERGFTLHQAGPTGAELPADTTPFAQALGLASRSSLQNNGAPSSWRLAGARTDAVNLPFEDCAAQITAHPRWVLWHHWPDKRLHELAGYGKGLTAYAAEAAESLASDGFWKLVERMATGRRLVITADHGYAASGLFPDTSDKDQTKHLKGLFKAGRWVDDSSEPSEWVPPIDLVLDTRHGRNQYVLGQRKWRAQGGYPTLTHGGLSVLEVAVPFIEVSRSAGE